MATGPHVSISPEVVTYWGNFPVTNSMVTSLVVSGIILIIAVWFRYKFSAKTNRPKGIQNVLEWVIESLYNLVYSTSGDAKRARLFFPMVASFFIFILLNNWFGLVPIVGNVVVPAPHHDQSSIVLTSTSNSLLPTLLQVADAQAKIETEIITTTENIPTNVGENIVSEVTSHSAPVSLFRPSTADLNMTLALGIISMLSVQIWGVKFLKLSYFKKFIDFSSPINFFVGILEIISEFAKIISFAFRLFGNIFAGEVLLVVISFLTLLLVPVPFYGLEVFVGFIQALVFSMLTLVFFNMATHKH